MNLIKTKTLLAEKFRTLYYFYKQLGVRLFITLFFNCLVVLMDGLGLTLFIPLLKIADDSSKNVESGDKMTMYLRSIFEAVNLPISIPVVLVFIVIVFCLKGLFTYFTSVFQGETLANFSRTLRLRVFTDLTRITYKSFVKSDFGKLQNTINGETWRVESSAAQYIETLKNIIIVIIYLGMSMTLDYRFSILVIIFGLLFNTFYKQFYKKTKQKSVEITHLGHSINNLITQSLYNFKYMKATDVIGNYRTKTATVINDVFVNSLSITKINAFLQSIREPVMMLIVSGVILIQLLFFKTGIGTIIIVLLFFYRAMGYLLALQTSWNSFLATSGALDNMVKFEKFLDENREITNGKTPVTKVESIQFSDVGLYFDSFKVLKNIDLEIRQKETVALVGESGSGKSTVVNVACGLYTPEEGKFLVNGLDIHDVDMSQYRKRIGYISQEPTVFAGSIFENVTLWSEKTPETVDKFWNAVNKSNLRSFIESLPEKEDAVLGNSGINLSGGQKQRISIARELYKDIDILIMDEATSALDSETEREVQESIDNLEGDLIILIIAHRLSTIVNADRVVVMKAGHVEGIGTFEELKQKSEYFNKLASLQGL